MRERSHVPPAPRGDRRLDGRVVHRATVVAIFAGGVRREGHRVVEYQQALQAVGVPLLGWATVDGRDFYVRQFRNMKGSVSLKNISASALANYAGIAGRLLAKGHARTSGASMIAGYVGGSSNVDKAMARVARAYADQTEADHEALLAAVKSGRVPIAEGA
jgi:hypothetical protein